MMSTPSSRSTLRTNGLTTCHSAAEVFGSEERKRVTESWLISFESKRASPVAEACPNEQIR